MSIENRDLKAGTALVARHKGQEYKAEVVETEAGIRYRLPDGREFKSPSSAGSAVMGGTACNGWRFWSIPGENGASEKRKPAAKKEKPAAKKTSKKQQPATSFASRRRSEAKGFKRLDDGRFFCSVCMDAFEAPDGVDPIGCPKGHEPGAQAPEEAEAAATA